MHNSQLGRGGFGSLRCEEMMFFTHHTIHAKHEKEYLHS